VTILITAANSAEAHRLKNNLKANHIILGDYMDLPEFMLIAGKMIKLPNPQSVAYTHEMLTLCLDNNIDAIYALQQQEANVLKAARQLFKEYNIDILSTTNEI
jgi:hypothetical protein